jgi:hypothetical protein
MNSPSQKCDRTLLRMKKGLLIVESDVFSFLFPEKSTLANLPMPKDSYDGTERQVLLVEFYKLTFSLMGHLLSTYTLTVKIEISYRILRLEI